MFLPPLQLVWVRVGAMEWKYGRERNSYDPQRLPAVVGEFGIYLSSLEGRLSETKEAGTVLVDGINFDRDSRDCALFLTGRVLLGGEWQAWAVQYDHQGASGVTTKG